METELLKSDGGFISPDVHRVQQNGKQVLVKNYNACPGRNLIARYMARREYQLLDKLRGVEGIPGGAKLYNGSYLIRDFVDGEHIKTFEPGELPNEVYNRLETLINRMHEHDIVHLDLRHMKNVIVSDENQPYLVDMETALDLSVLSFAPMVQDLLRWVDRSALLRIKNRFFSSLFTEEDRDVVRQFQKWRKYWIFSPYKLREKDRV